MTDDMNDYQKLWWKKMILIHGTEEAVREFMSKSAKKKTTKTGFSNPDTLKKAIETRTKNRG